MLVGNSHPTLSQVHFFNIKSQSVGSVEVGDRNYNFELSDRSKDITSFKPWNHIFDSSSCRFWKGRLRNILLSITREI